MHVTIQRAIRGFTFLAVLLVSCVCPAAELDELSLERWKQLREVERYQLKIAEEYYRDKKWKIAGDEYEKFLTLYKTSEAHAKLQKDYGITVTFGGGKDE